MTNAVMPGTSAAGHGAVTMKFGPAALVIHNFRPVRRTTRRRRGRGSERERVALRAVSA
jgi:hypothetical protein